MKLSDLSIGMHAMAVECYDDAVSEAKKDKEGGSRTDLHQVKTWKTARQGIVIPAQRAAESANRRGTDQHTSSPVMNISPPARRAESNSSWAGLPWLEVP